MAAKPNPRTPGTQYRSPSGEIKTYGHPDGTPYSSGGDGGGGGGVPDRLPDSLFGGAAPAQGVAAMAANIVDYDKYIRQFAMEDYDTAKKRLDEDYARFQTLSKETEKIGLDEKARNYGGSIRRASVGYVSRGIGINPGKSGIAMAEGRERREGYTKDVDLFKRGLEVQRQGEEISYGRRKKDIETGQRRNTVSELSALSNALYNFNPQ